MRIIFILFAAGISMFVCMCKKVTDGQLKQAVALGASSWEDVSRMTQCSTQCGKCACLAQEIVDEALLNRHVAQHIPARHYEELAYAVR
ncbi:bacterioferritin-associated ferredoxin [Kushneria avicenniae]|uniref:Bacterioferritin-associated ferredoxin n=1 Tax=Kushneria avicenniae TaxID=402385 RepID=A0A1I1L312_9GAMM|nr:(2Fe-2S)-binding protein [Kushneria avicenniae]SFC67414.1 bacterioferritin-associated ferredoxin [Kushneria avicenniae]